MCRDQGMGKSVRKLCLGKKVMSDYPCSIAEVEMSQKTLCVLAYAVREDIFIPNDIGHWREV